MEPLAASSGVSPVLRPATALQADLSAVLREGQVVAGDVLQRLDGGTVLVGIGRHRVPADAGAELVPGRRLLLRVERPGGELRLVIVHEAGPGDPSLAAALRAAAGEDLPLGELLQRLAGALRADPRAAELLARLAAGAYRPDAAPPGAAGAGAAASTDAAAGPGRGDGGLREALARSGSSFEAGLLRLALAREPRATLAAGLTDVGRAWIAAALERTAGGVGPPTPGELAAAGRALAEALAAAVTELAPRLLVETRGGATLEALLGRLAARLRAAAGELGPGTVRDALRAALVRPPGTPAAARAGNVLAQLVAALGPGTSAAELVERARADAKGRLLAALAALEDEGGEGGGLRGLLGRAVAGLDLDQLLDLARREADGGRHWSLPVATPSGWTSLHVLRHGGGRGGAGGEAGTRLSIGVELGALGPVRADLLVAAGRVTARLVVARPEVHGLLAERAGELERAASAAAERPVRVAVVLGDRAETDLGAQARDVRFLHEHPLMDVEG